MPKKTNARKTAARHREAAKRGDSIPTEPEPQDPDSSYSASDASEDDSATSDVEMVVRAAESNVSQNSIDRASKRKWKQENADILPEKTNKRARTTEWRNKKGITRKARAYNMQPSVKDFFSRAREAPQNVARSFTHLRQEEEEEEIVEEQSECSKDAGGQVATLEILDLSSGDVPSGGEAGGESETSKMRIDGPGSQHGDSEFSPMLYCPDQLSKLAVDSNVDSEHLTDTELPKSPGPQLVLSTKVQSVERHAEPVINLEKAQLVYNKVQKLILKNRRDYKKKKKLLTDDNAAARLVDLEALDQYNELRFKLTREKLALGEKLKHEPGRTRHRLKLRIARIKPAEDASKAVASRCSRGPYFATTLRSMAHTLFKTGELPENRQGKGAHHETYLARSDVMSALQNWVKGVLTVEEGGFAGSMKAPKLRRYVNQFLFPKLEIEATISESTAVRWLKKLGFKMSRVTKGVYVDGHERPDVVLSREEFIRMIFNQILPFANSYNGENLEESSPLQEEKIHYPIFHDETCFHANDLENYIWMREGEQPLRNKSRGRIIHISDFIIEACGRLYLSPEEILEQMKLPKRPTAPSSSEDDPEMPDLANVPPDVDSQPSKRKGKGKAKPKNTRKKTTNTDRTFTGQENEWVPPPPPAPFKSYRVSSFDARRIIYPGANYDPWWDMPQLIAQTKDAIEIFEAKFHNGIAVFIFDCSSAHEAFSADALLAHKMNRGPGGKQPVMRDTVIPSTGAFQSMIFSSDYDGKDKDNVSLAGRPKGMEQVLRERGLLQNLERKHGSKLVGVCANCKKSQAAREAAAKEARSKQDEVEGSGISNVNTRGVTELDDDVGRSKDCCMQRVLSLQEDFNEEKPLLQLVIEKAGHKCLFLPKFHCELNPIEMVWGQAKKAFREIADGTFKTAQDLVPKCLDKVTLKNIRAYFRHCWRYMSAYNLGLNIKQAAYAVKKYSSHRRVPASIMMDVNIILRGQHG